MLEVKDITKSFGGVRAVRDCSFSIKKERITALIGPNGAGKTTLFNIANGFLDSDDGRVIFNNEDITRFSPWKRSRRGISRTFQLSRVFKNLTLEQNFLLAVRQDDDLFWRMFLRPGSDERFHDEIKQVCNFVGLDKPLHTVATDLSYGQQKLFDLARALLNPHSLLLLDEPVAGVNPVIRTKLKELLIELKKREETILLIEHDMDFVRGVADWVVVMDQGTVLTEGEPEQVLNDKKVLEAYLGKE